MKLLLNDKEIIRFLLKLLNFKKYVNYITFNEVHTTECIHWVNKKKRRPITSDIKIKIKNKITKSVERDLSQWYTFVKEIIETEKKKKFVIVQKNLDKVIASLGEEQVFELYKKDSQQNFIKTVGLQISPDAAMCRRSKFNNYQEDCLLRNTVGNEQLLINKIDNHLPFWFIDSGFTNFLETNKKWHRLTRNHIHWGGYFRAPVDRLGNFPKFPQQWRQGGDKILVIEPGPFAANIMHVDIKQWRYQVEEEIRKYSDLKIVFREKAPKKQRAPLYKHLLDEDYFCLININSNAAVEAIWAGVPVITLSRHISNQVSRQEIKGIKDLYRGSLAEWLAILSYSQFTYDELLDGTAYNLLRINGNA